MMMAANPTAAANAAAPALRVQDLRIDLPPGADRPHAVQNASFEVMPGEVVCLLGESGSGKSVIARAVMGLLPEGLHVSGGSITLCGEDLLAASPARRRALRGTGVAMVFQEPMTALNPVMRCGAQVEEVLAQHTTLGAAQRREQVLSIFARVRLPDPERIHDAYPHQLSGGQRQRIVIAMALILRPALLVCDEPTTALDVTTQAEILALVRELQHEHRTAVLFITHDFGVVADIADRVVVMQLGRQVECGPRDQVLRRPEADYTRMLLDAVPGLEPARRPSDTERPLLLDASAIGKTYTSGAWPGRRRVVQAASEVSLQVHAGETVGIVGESGSGKSTVARCIARLIEPSAGAIHLLPAQPRGLSRRAQLSAFRRAVQVVFQDPNRSLNPRRTVGQSIVEGAVNFGATPAQAWERAEALMELVRLRPDALHRYPSEFSGGQRQRLCIARALACEPRVLIADEAVSALDVSVQAQILKLLADIQQRLAIGILFITHDLRVASQICDRLIVMHQGRVVEQGPTRDVVLSPRQDYTRALLAAAPGRGYRFGEA
ncbi:putative peptide transport fused subunits of ABC superfamily: ATP-binding components [Cupriavidus oxalaticus]|uniref:Peptide transport fused subunits of ABC superfamily: ATP-binding components n=2 Tax=Cupriavidus oxalaticus TaxID=96344 RepID=A0A375G1W1_9BURK|nr:putative peptide transport fused subunits of ABC superfamily: ATP-binding components [Cupriavidus oxalaticus]SPC12757.1 putative peptide transport fused subunits of ABC superfamily: ATP-binding components [Cupriavidus oxalaticus]